MRGRALTTEQYARYAAAHKRLLLSVFIAIVYCLGVVVVDRFASLEPYGLYITIGLFPVVGFVIWGMAGFRCPVCRSTPKARSLSLTSNEVAYSSMVALFPRECSFCGVQFAPVPPKREA